MIKYSLRCDHGHGFEGWFRTGADFDAQSGKGLLVCGRCGSAKVEKALMAPNVAPSDKRAAVPDQVRAVVTAPVPQAMTAGMPREMMEMAKRIRAHLRENAENVGPRFAEEARKIHYDEAKPRGIYGQATPQEARALHEEGIEVHSLPALPDDAN
jgi:hypothetical protein